MGYSETVPMRVRERRRGVGKTVLIVEDNELNMKLFHDLLEAHGYDTLQTKDGVEALAARAPAPARPDPDGYPAARSLRACEVTKWIKEDDELQRDPGHRRDRLRDEGRRGEDPEGGCEAYIAKPISVAQLPANRRALPLRRMARPT